MAKQTKVYDYNPDKVREALVGSFRLKGGETTAADLVALTGLPKNQVDAELRAVSDEYGARLRVTESGELLYSFPNGLKSRYRGVGPFMKRFGKRAWTITKACLAFLFKAWIAVMLVGYFVLFLALAVLALLASFALSASGSKDSKSDRRGGGLGGFMLAGRLVDLFVRIWFYSELFKSPGQRQHQRGDKKDRKPLHKAIFSFVFGDGDPNPDWATVEKKAVVAFIQASKGVITLPEFMVLTGLRPLEAEEAINRYMLEFEGSPEVTEGGTIYYAFPSLMRTSGGAREAFGLSGPVKSLAAFSANPRKANVWFCVFNAVNILFGSYFIWGSLAVGEVPAGMLHGGFGFFYSFVYYLAERYIGAAQPLLLTVLGLVPVSFAALFYAVPALRSLAVKRANEELKKENQRRILYRAAWEADGALEADTVQVVGQEALPSDKGAKEAALRELAAWKGAEPGQNGKGYFFESFVRERRDMASLRAGITLSDYDIGKAVFDSHA